jgi:hypothetical protein
MLLPSSHFSPFSANTVMAPTVGEELGSPEFWCKMLISIFLVLLGGVFAG